MTSRRRFLAGCSILTAAVALKPAALLSAAAAPERSAANLQGRVPIHFGTGAGLSTRVLAQGGVVEAVTLTANQIPSHTHAFLGSNGPGTQGNPAGTVPGASPSVTLYLDEAPAVALNAAVVATAGGSQPHSNVQPYLCLNYIISLFGIFPSPN